VREQFRIKTGFYLDAGLTYSDQQGVALSRRWLLDYFNRQPPGWSSVGRVVFSVEKYPLPAGTFYVHDVKPPESSGLTHGTPERRIILMAVHWPYLLVATGLPG